MTDKDTHNELLDDASADDMTGEEASTDGVVKHKSKLGRGIYLLPNLFTTASLFSGFYAIVAAMNGHFDNAAVAIFVSMVLDGLDGRVARMTNTQSAFGAEYDSLSDMVAFGVAPALVAFSLNLQTLGNLGWIATFITQLGSVDKRYFVGLPSPSAAAVVAGFVWTIHQYEQTRWLALLTMLVVAGAGVLMVSNILYQSFKEFDLKRRVPFATLLIMVLVFAVVALDAPKVLLGGFMIYTLSGPITAFLHKSRKQHNDKV